MTKHLTFLAFAAAGLLVALPARAEAQAVRSFTAPAKGQRDRDVPREYRPPAGTCRIWLDNVPPKQQPAPTDCATAVRNKPRNGRVIFPEPSAEKDNDRKGRDSTGRPRKPENDRP